MILNRLVTESVNRNLNMGVELKLNKVFLHFISIFDDFQSRVHMFEKKMKTKKTLFNFQLHSTHYSANATPHCNDDLNKINEQRNLMINSSKWMSWL